MFELSPIVLGTIFLLLGVCFFLLPLLFLRLIPKLQPLSKTPSPPPDSPQIPAHNEAVLQIQSGGRVAYLNQQAREFFNVWEEEPNLESLARRTRPSEAFLMLCVSEGQARFSLNGRFVEGTSYYSPDSTRDGMARGDTILVTLRRPQLVIEDDSPLISISQDFEGSEASEYHPADLSAQALSIFTELSQAMAANLDLEITLKTILESIERLLPSDFLEITIWEAEFEHLAPYRLVGLPGVDRRLEKAAQNYHADEGYSGYLITHREPLLVKDVNTFRSARPTVERQRYPFQSYLGVPLLIASDLVGTLELASLSKENYSENDREILRLLAGQAAVAVNNAVLYKQELQRSVELAGLANLAQAVCAIRDLKDLYTRLIEGISPLMPVDILGFLIYDENRRVLEGQVPFKGIQEDVIEWYQQTIQSGSPADEILKAAETIVTTDAPEDPRFITLELNHLAQAMGIRHTVLTPLASGGRMLGYLQVAKKRDGTPFDQNDLRILAIIAGQSAPIIENATLVQQSRHRTQRAETLRRIASLTNSAATLDEILKFSILDLARLLGADVAAIFLLDESRGELRLHKGSIFGVPPEVSNRLARIPTDDPQFESTVTAGKQQFTCGDLSEATDILPLYHTLADASDVRSVVDVPLVIRERGIGELMIGSLRPNFFAGGDVQTVETTAGQLAAAIERSTLYSQTDQSLRQRVEQLTALTRISRELNTTLELPHLLQLVYNEVLRTTRADCGTILLFELVESQADQFVQSDRTAANLKPEIRLYFGDDPGSELHPLEQIVLQEGESVIVDDFDAFQSKEDQPLVAQEEKKSSPVESQAEREGIIEIPQGLQPAHSGVRSALVVPIAYQGQVAGLIHLHAKASHHFGDTEREIGEALAIQAAIALGNANRYREQIRRGEQLNQRVETLSKLFEVSQVLQTEQPLEQSLESIAYAIQAATPFDTVLLSVYNPESNHLDRVTGAGIPLPTIAKLRARPQPWDSVQSLLRPEFCLGRAYLIPSERSSVVPADIHKHQVTTSMEGHAPGKNDWHPDDTLIVPLFSNAGAPLGLVSVDTPRNNLRPDRLTLETLEIFSSQVALIIESQQKVQDLKLRVDKIQDELELAQEAAQQARQHLPTLLHKDLEQTLAIEHLSQRARRINAGLDIAEIVGKQPTWSDVLSALAQETLARMDFDVVLVAEPTAGGVSLTHSLGIIPDDVNPKALLGQRNPLRQCLQTGELLLVSNLGDDTEWHNATLLRALETRSFLCLPIGDITNGHTATEAPDTAQGALPNTLVAVLATSRTPLAPFTSDDEQLFTLLARQVAIALQNLNLLDETTRRLREVNLLLDFSRQLGSLDPSSILHTLVDSALHVIPSAQSAMVVLWDATQGLLVPRAALGYAHLDDLMEMLYQPGEGLPGQVFEEKRALLLDEVDFAKHYNLSPDNLLRYRNATGGQLPVSCMAVPVMTAQRGDTIPLLKPDDRDETAIRMDEVRATPLGVLVLDSPQATAAFSEEDLAVVTSLAQQTALTLDNARLYQASVQRSGQLQALTDVSTTITSSLQTEELIATLLDQLQAILPYDTGTLWLRQKGGTGQSRQSGADRMVVRAARGFEDSDQRIGLTIDVQDSQLLNEMITTSRPIWVANVLKDPRFRALPVDEDLLAEIDQDAPSAAIGYEHLSWLGVPLIASGEVIGVIALEKTESSFYTPDDIQVATAFAGQAAVGLENAKLYQESVNRALELDQRSQTLTILNRLSSELSSSLDATHILDSAVRELLYVMPCTSVSALLVKYGPESDDQDNTGVLGQSRSRVILQAEYPYESLDEESTYGLGTVLPNIPLFERLQETQGIFNTDDVGQESELEPLQEFLAHHYTRSLLIVPIVSGGTGEDATLSEPRFHGMLLAHNSHPYRFAADEVELARTISNQVAIALQNARLAEDLELRVRQRTAELGREHQRSETLLRIITELSATLDLDQVLHSTLQVLSEYVDAEQITILIARPGEKKLHRLASIGYTPEPPEEGSPTTLDIDQGLAGWIITQRQSVLVEDVLKDDRWIKISTDEPARYFPFQHRSALGVPLMSGAEALGCLLLFHPNEGHFSMDQLDLVQAAGNQVAVAVNNAELYRLIRDQAEDLGNMLRSQQIETSRSKAILEAVADGVLVTDAKRLITLFNESGENILGLERSQVLGRSMEHFSGLFGRATRSWMETISNWSQDPTTYQPGDTYAEQITLEDGRVISVHLAPVSLRNDFLGTVSIFQDITHQVEVDRLKSEFVATVSHELRTPMTSIKGYVEVLLMGAAGEISEKQRRFLHVVKTNTERLSVLVNDLLDISQIESGQAKLSMQPLNVNELVDQAIDALERRTEGDEKSITIEKEIQPGLPRVLGDAERIFRILDNLLDNAYQYNTPEGLISIRMHQSDNEVQIDIQDTGVGIHPDDQPQVFERFYRGESPLVLGVSGTGLGLSIVKNLVEMHNGRIWVESTGVPGEGSTFSFTLPVYEPEAE